MEWRNAAMKFVESLKGFPVEAVLACGSYVTGNPSKHSDIDLQIILKPGTKWRERGNRIVDGFLIEYFANPPEKIREYFKKEHEERKMFTAHMLATGEIIVDKSGIGKQLKKEANRWLGRKFKKPGKKDIEAEKYGIWDMMDNLEEVFEDHPEDFWFVYFNSFQLSLFLA